MLNDSTIGPGILLLVASLGFGAASEVEAQPSLACFVSSADTEAGFKDESLLRFQKELRRFGEPHLDIVETKESADVRVQFLGRGKLSVQIPESESTQSRIMFEPNPEAETLWALARIGTFVKPMSSKGPRNRALSRLASDLSQWLADNQDHILKRN